jgi:hypothetical protein
MTCAKHTMFSPTKVSFVTVQNSVLDLRCYFPCNKFKRGRVSNKRWSTHHGLLATDTLASIVDTLALITRRISFLKGGRAAATVNVSEFRRNYSVTLVCEHNSFQKRARNPKHSYIKANFPIRNNGNSDDSFQN